jgi:hypothetical protein
MSRWDHHLLARNRERPVQRADLAQRCPRPQLALCTARLGRGARWIPQSVCARRSITADQTAGSVCVVGQQDGHVTRHYGRLDVGPLPTAIGASVWLGRSRLGARIRSGHAGAVVRSLSDTTRAGVEAARDESFGTGDQCLQIELVPLSEPAEDLITGSLPSVGAANVRVRSGTSPAFELRFTSDHDRLA